MVVSAAAATAAALWAAVDDGQFGPAVAVVLMLLVRVQGPSEQWRRLGAAGLVLAVAAVVGAVSGPTGPMFIALLLVMADLAQTVSARGVLLVGALAAAVVAATSLVTADAAPMDSTWIWPLLLVPMVGLVVHRLGATQSMEGTAALESATVALDEVVRLAERMPAGFDRWTVARAVRAELLEASRRSADAPHLPHLLLCDSGVLFGVGPPWLRRAVGLVSDLPSQRRGRTWRAVSSDELPGPVAGELGPGSWLVHRLAGGAGHVVLVPRDLAPSALDAVEDVLRPAAVALANVDRFERLQQIATDAAQVRVAHDLHDGVAQALTHVRFELDLLGLQHAEVLGEVQRIRAVADAALSEVRRTVDELREAIPLTDRLERHVDLLRSFVPAAIELDLPANLDLDPDAADDVFRIVQEALSNAIRHADADTMAVAITVDDATISVIVADDGVGIPDCVRQGVGLNGMHSRAQRLGGDVVVRPRAGGGTVVQLEAPGAAALESPAATPPSPQPTKPQPRLTRSR